MLHRDLIQIYCSDSSLDRSIHFYSFSKSLSSISKGDHPSSVHLKRYLSDFVSEMTLYSASLTFFTSSVMRQSPVASLLISSTTLFGSTLSLYIPSLSLFGLTLRIWNLNLESFYPIDDSLTLNLESFYPINGALPLRPQSFDLNLESPSPNAGIRRLNRLVVLGRIGRFGFTKSRKSLPHFF
jgi:hypothetical protein